MRGAARARELRPTVERKVAVAAVAAQRAGVGRVAAEATGAEDTAARVFGTRVEL